jgi:hypothetical protein
LYELATDAEIASVAESYPGRTKHELYLRWAELRAYARGRRWQAQKYGDRQKAELWEVAQAALEDRAEVVELISVKQKVSVCPASWARIMTVEDCDWWLMRLCAARLVLKNDADKGEPIENLDETLEKIRTEIAHTRAVLYGEVTAPSPAPANAPVDWADSITPIEEAQLLQAWHDVNTDILKRLRAPVSKRDRSPHPPSWSMVFQSVAWRNNEYPRTIIHDWSLVSICAENVIEAVKQDERKVN